MTHLHGSTLIFYFKACKEIRSKTFLILESKSNHCKAGVCVLVASEDAESREEEGDDGEVDGSQDQPAGSRQDSARPELSLTHVTRHLQPEHADQDSKCFPGIVVLKNF